MGSEAPHGDMPSSDWSDKLEAATNHWLPAYGFQQPSQLQEALLSHDYMSNDGLGGATGYVYLETIAEETSDDLKSDSEYSEIAGWPDTDSEAGSVIHIPNVIGPSSCNSTGDWSGSERDLAVPKKRRRRLFMSSLDDEAIVDVQFADVNNDPGVNDDDDDDNRFLLPPLTSRSSSLLQFEQLEKQCDTVFRASASHEQFVHSSPSLTSSFSFDSLEIAPSNRLTLNRRFSGSVDSLDDDASTLSSSRGSPGGSSSELVSSDDEITRRAKSTNRVLTSHRSYDSLVSSVVDRSEMSGELSQSCDGCESRLDDNVESTAAPPRGLYKTVECLTTGYENPSERDDKNDKKAVRQGQRSAENLSEDSGFGEHIPRRTSSSGLSATIIAESEAAEEEEEVGAVWDDETKSKYSPSWQSAPDLSGTNPSEAAPNSDADTVDQLSSEQRPIASTTSLIFALPNDDELIVTENKPLFSTFKPAEMNSRIPVVSTPNLFQIEASKNAPNQEYAMNFPEKNELNRAQSFKNASFSNPNLARKTRSRGSNIQITTSFINLTDSRGSLGGGSSKWVHFSPVVSEVSWKDSDRDVDDDVWSDDEFDLDEKVEPERRRSSGGGGRPSGPPPPVPPPKETGPPGASTLSGPLRGASSAPNVETLTSVNGEMETTTKTKSGLGGFFRRFSLRRLSGKDKRKKEAKKENGRPPLETAAAKDEEMTVIIPLNPPKIQNVKPPVAPVNAPPTASDVQRTRPPPPPPPRRTASAMSSGCRVAGLLETDLDSPAAAERPPHQQTPNHQTHHQTHHQAHPPPKTRSLLDLGGPARTAQPCPTTEDVDSAENRAKSMEFLLDKDNQYAAKPPENELQKVGERVMSEHELRVQRSLQKLNVPDWYKSSTVPPQGFLLKRHSEGGGGGGVTSPGWQGLSSKTTSLSSLGSLQSATPRSPSNLLSPSPTPSAHTFSRWSTSRLNSNPTSTSTSPCGSARSSFNYRQPYLGWRSQERLSNPRTPAERLAAGLLSKKQQQPSVPNMNELSEVHSSIKEVTSAIVHYVSGSRADDRLSPALGRHYDYSSSRSASPRGSNSRLCWLESSFVGNKPIDVPETPVSLTATPEHAKGTADLYLDLTTTHRPNSAAINGLVEYKMPGVSVSGVSGDGEGSRRPSPGSTTMEDVLDSLLGLASSTSRSPSPSVAHRSCSDLTNHLAVSASNSAAVNEPIYAEVRRHSDCNASNVSPNSCNHDAPQNFVSSNTSADNEPIYAEVRRHSDCNADAARGRRVSFDMAVAEGEIVRCRYNKCNKTASLSEAKKTYKTCHNCTHVYCSRECRRAHWDKHRKTCLHSRVGALCRKVMSNIKEDEEALHHVSLISRRGYLSKGRGAVKVLFCRPKNAEDFIAEGKSRLGEPSYVKWTDLQTDEIGKEMYDELVRLCKAYNPDTRLVLYVVVCVVSEVPSTGGAVKWEMQMVSRCAKLKLAPGLVNLTPSGNESQSHRDGEPETLILTSLPGARDQGTRKARQISFTNIQRHLRQRGISLRKQFPEVYQRLCAYVEGAERFVPVTIYPRDVASGKNFMCIIMPDAEPEKLELIPKNSDHVQTIDVSVDPDSTV